MEPPKFEPVHFAGPEVRRCLFLHSSHVEPADLFLMNPMENSEVAQDYEGKKKTGWIVGTEYLSAMPACSELAQHIGRCLSSSGIEYAMFSDSAPVREGLPQRVQSRFTLELSLRHLTDASRASLTVKSSLRGVFARNSSERKFVLCVSPAILALEQIDMDIRYVIALALDLKADYVALTEDGPLSHKLPILS